MKYIIYKGLEVPYCKDTPLTKAEIKEMVNRVDGESVSVIVRVNFGDCLDNGWEWFWDELSEKVTGSPVGVQDIEYEIVGVEGNDTLVWVGGMFNLEDLGLTSEDEEV